LRIIGFDSPCRSREGERQSRRYNNIQAARIHSGFPWKDHQLATPRKQIDDVNMTFLFLFCDALIQRGFTLA
jgi:hypothetical protein